MRLLKITAVAALVALSGCSMKRLSSDNHNAKKGVRVSHKCGADCNEHFWDGDILKVEKGHRHAVDCGHYWNGDRWVPVIKHFGRHNRGAMRVSWPSHRHNTRCGCAYQRHTNSWLKVNKGHIHGPGCGHDFVDGRWSFKW